MVQFEINKKESFVTWFENELGGFSMLLIFA